MEFREYAVARPDSTHSSLQCALTVPLAWQRHYVEELVAPNERAAVVLELLRNVFEGVPRAHDEAKIAFGTPPTTTRRRQRLPPAAQE